MLRVPTKLKFLPVHKKFGEIDEKIAKMSKNSHKIAK
jgi:hypothetical protein